MSCGTRFAILFALLLPAISGAVPDLYGEIISPNYPQGYPNNVQQSWNITMPPGYGIRIYFTHLDIEPSENCTYDSVQIVIGDVVEANLCGQHLGNARQNSMQKYDRYFPSNSLTVMFKSDFSNQQRYTGFAAYYVAEDVDECEENQEVCSHFCNNYLGGFFCSCPPEYFLHEDSRTCGVNCSGAVYTDLKGEITSPDYPNPYPENTRCKYRIQLEYGYHIVVKFQNGEFDIEPDDSGRCAYDKLVVQVKDKTYGPFCGSSIPNPPKIETQSNFADIIFQTDLGGQHKGWKIRYHEEPVQCSGVVSPHSTLEPEELKYVFKDVVTVVCIEGYEIVENDKGMKSFKTACQSDGQWSRTDLACQPVNCGPPENPENAVVTYLSGADHYDYGSEIQYSCTETYYQMESPGNGLYRCSADGHWENKHAGKNLPNCVPAWIAFVRGVQGPEDIPSRETSCIEDIPGRNICLLLLGSEFQPFKELLKYFSRAEDVCDFSLTCVMIISEPPPPQHIIINAHSRYEVLNNPDTVCGASVSLTGSGRIFGGTKAVAGMFPWQVFFATPRGAGALISDDWVLTAAHVVESEPSPVMYVGIRDLAEIRRPDALVAKDIYFHSDWKKNVREPRVDYDNDIALIKLKTKVKLGPQISPICLPGRDTGYDLEEGKTGFISGWGRTETREKVRILHMAGIHVEKMQECQEVKPDVGESSQYVFSQNMICAGGKGKDSCQGDSGGAFAVQVPHKEALYYAAGIVSWGPRCGTYGLYTNVRNYLDWIEETMTGQQGT